MKRTQVQLPDHLFEEVKRIAARLDWSVAEVLRRGAEYMVRCYPPTADEDWEPPVPRRLGAFRSSAERWRELAYDPEAPEAES